MGEKIVIWKSQFGELAASRAGDFIPAGHGATPLDAAALAYEQIGGDLPIEWKTLPWTEAQIAVSLGSCGKAGACSR